MSEEIFRETGTATEFASSATGLFNIRVRAIDNPADADPQPGMAHGSLLISGLLIGPAEADPESALWRIDFTAIFPGSGGGDPYLIQETTELATRGSAPATPPTIALQAETIEVSSGHWTGRTIRWVVTHDVTIVAYDGFAGVP